jgi:hypothetical protein
MALGARGGGRMSLDDIPLNIAALPAVVAGPVLRRVTRTRASVWLASTKPDAVTLHIRVAGQPATETAVGAATPVQVGSHLWIVVVTGGSPAGAAEFTAGAVYEYRLSSPGWAAEPAWGDLAIASALPAFAAPPASVDDLVVLHTSCRNPHGGGRDGLAFAADVIAEGVAAGIPNARPQLLVMSGDQIYADEIPGPLQPRVLRVATDLVTIDETGVFGPLPRINGRQAPSEAFGFTSSVAANQIWTFGEFLAAYLLQFADVLWPAVTPTWDDVNPVTDLPPGVDLAAAKDEWDANVDALGRFRAALPAARRVLAAVPSLMVLDDHEITDDWNLDYPWAQAVYASAGGSRVVANGLLAYALCEHWGNVPDRFATAGTPEAQFLNAVAYTGANPDTPAVRELIGAPSAPLPAPPSALRVITTPGTLRYDFTFGPDEGWPVRLLALDERTAREFNRVDHPAARISMAGLAAMLPGRPAGDPPSTPTLVVAPSPVLGTHLIEHVVQPAASLLPGGSEYADFESWSAATPQYQELLRRLAQYAPIVLLGGDVHYSATASLNYDRNGTTMLGAGVTSSAAKNSDAKTMAVHLLGDLAMRLGLERPRRYVGFNALSAAQQASLASPPPPGAMLPYDDMVDVLLGRVFRAGQETPAVLSVEVANSYGFGAGDWHYDVAPVDDQRMPAPGQLLTDITNAPAPWPNFDATSSFTMLRALRASDLHRIGRMWDGLPQISVLTFTSAPVTLHHELVSPVGEDPAGTTRHTTVTAVRLGA